MEVEIKGRYTQDVIYAWHAPKGCGGNSTAQLLGLAAVAAVDAGVSLQGADLRGAYLRLAHLTDADLRGADLRGADVSHAEVRGVDLRGANLEDAVLTLAYLRGSIIIGASLRRAYLVGTDFRGADMDGADFRGAVWSPEITLQSTPIEVANLTYPVWVLDEHMQVGRWIGTFAEWAEFRDGEVEDMGGEDYLAFWHEHKNALLALCATRGEAARA